MAGHGLALKAVAEDELFLKAVTRNRLALMTVIENWRAVKAVDGNRLVFESMTWRMVVCRPAVKKLLHLLLQ